CREALSCQPRCRASSYPEAPRPAHPSVVGWSRRGAEWSRNEIEYNPPLHLMSSPAPRSLFDLLACPVSRNDIAADADGRRLSCNGCRQRYPVLDGGPIMLADPSRAMVSHQRELPIRPGYSRWKERVILRSLTDAQIALDVGAGRQQL